MNKILYFVIAGVILLILVFLIILFNKNNKKEIKSKEEVPKSDVLSAKVQDEDIKDQVIENHTEENKEVTENENLGKKELKQKYMITYNKEESLWVVKKTNSARASKKFKTKKEALEFAERLSENQGLNLSVQKRDGKFQKIK